MKKSWPYHIRSTSPPCSAISVLTRFANWAAVSFSYKIDHEDLVQVGYRKRHRGLTYYVAGTYTTLFIYISQKRPRPSLKQNKTKQNKKKNDHSNNNTQNNTPAKTSCFLVRNKTWIKSDIWYSKQTELCPRSFKSWITPFYLITSCKTNLTCRSWKIPNITD